MMIPVKGKRVEDVGNFVHDFPGSTHPGNWPRWPSPLASGGIWGLDDDLLFHGFALNPFEVFELATYKRLNPHGKIVLAPLFLEKIVGLFYLGNVCAAFFYLLLRGSGAGAHIVLPGIVLCCLPYILTIHNLRGYYVQKHQLVSQFQYFDLESVECAEENDRLFVNTAIAELYGSNEALTSFVRGPLLRELLDPLCRTAIPQKYILFIITPMTSLVLEFLLSLWTAGAPLDVLLLYFFSVGVVGICANWQVLVYLVNLLCDHLAEPVSKRTPAFEPWALHQFLGVHMSKCAN